MVIVPPIPTIKKYGGMIGVVKRAEMLNPAIIAKLLLNYINITPLFQALSVN